MIEFLKNISKIKRLTQRASRTVMILSAIIITCLGAGFQTFAATPQEAVNNFSKTPRLPSGSMAVLISDLSSGKVIASYNAGKPLIPASIMKSVTIGSLSDIIDVDSSYETAVCIEGKIDSEGILHGNLIIEACGDPSINTTVWPKSENFVTEIIIALQNEGIKEINGDIIIDESYFAGSAIPPSWASGDLPHSYGTGSHSFNYSNNSVGKRSVSNPAAVFGTELKSALTRAGIGYNPQSVREGNRKEIFTHKSPEIKEIMRSCMMRSDNLFAESLLRRFGKEQGGDGSTPDAAEREMDYWGKKGADMTGVTIIDGSGLSRSNRVTANFMEFVLSNKAKDVEYASFFPLAGQEGTLKKFLADTPLDSYIAMKTGSMKGIQCYAGYKVDDDFAPTHSVVVIVNDFSCDRAYLRQQVEKMLLEVFSDDNITPKTLSNTQGD